jgi:ubiquitin C-terminal hydrolase
MMQMNIPINNFLGNNNLINQFQNFLFNPISANINQNQVNKRNKSAPRPKKNLPIINKPFANGLQNIGATCYMNATIQCLAHVEDFTKGLLRKKNEIKKNKYKNKLANAFLEVIENIWENNNIKYYAPYYFKELISKMNPLFEGIQANDSKDLVLFLLETMHNELNKVTVSNQFEDAIDQYNFENSFFSFANYFKNNFRSIVSDIFYGMYNSRMKCYSCGVVTHNIQCYNLLIIPLEEVRIFKKRPQNYVTIRECFEYYQKSDFMTGQNQIYCNNCKQMANSENNTTLLVGPKVLIINLNRGKGLQFNVTIDFNEYINISDFLFFKKPYIYYELIGVVTHFGPSSDSGHFIAFCKSFVDKRWYKYNDAIVTPCSFQDTKNTGVPYILFYSAQQ